MEVNALELIIARALLNSGVGTSTTIRVSKVTVGKNTMPDRQQEMVDWVSKNRHDEVACYWQANQVWKDDTKGIGETSDVATGYVNQEGQIIYCVDDHIPWAVELN